MLADLFLAAAADVPKTPEWYEVLAGIIALPGAIVGIFGGVALYKKLNVEAEKAQLETASSLGNWGRRHRTSRPQWRYSFSRWYRRAGSKRSCSDSFSCIWRFSCSTLFSTSSRQWSLV